jgi:anti-sigma-K factor RskA
VETGIHELTAGYALDALNDDERAAYEKHLADCDRCQAELASFWEVTGALALGASGPEPRPELRAAILSAARAEGGSVVDIATRRRRLPVALGAAAAIAAAVAIGLGLWSISLSNRLDTARNAADSQAFAAGVLADSGAREVALTGSGDGRVVVSRTGDAVLIVDGLPAPPADRTYQVWVVEDGTATSAGLFDDVAGAPVGLTKRVSPGAVVAVTLERAGGAEAPTSDPLVSSPPV